MSATLEAGVAARAALTYWACQLLGWGVNLFGQWSSAASTVGQAPPSLFLEVASLNVLGLVCTHHLRSMIKRRHWQTLPLSGLLPRIALASVALGLPMSILMHFMSIAGMWSGTVEQVQQLPAAASWMGAMDPLLIRAINWSVVFLFWIVLYLCITSLRDRRAVELRQSEMMRALQAGELRVLKSQLNPHFLFNSLNSVRALIADDPSAAQRAVTQLARTLRYTLNAGHEDVVSLERELEIVDDYLELESLRLGERLRIERHIAVQTDRARIPVMLLQTVVENAIKHGIAELPQGGVLTIRIQARDQHLMIEVENPRPATPAPTASEGVGLRNAAERLKLLFGDGATLRLDLSTPGLALASVRIPQPS